MKKKILFICGSMNQTTQMHQIAMHLSDYDHSFSPFYCHGFEEMLRKLGLIEFTIAGNQTVDRCRTYLRNHGLRVDYRGKNQPYDLVVTCTSRHSRNRKLGELIGTGLSAAEAIEKIGMVAEGYYTAENVVDLEEKYDLDLPICREVYRILYEGKNPAEAVGALMQRERKSEDGF